MSENGTETSRKEKGPTTILMETGQINHLRLFYKLFTDLKGCSWQGTLRVRGSFSSVLLTSMRGTFLREGKFR